jgi:hypothetical protein
VKEFDLEPTEYRRSDEPEPIFGFNGQAFLVVGSLVWIVGYCLSWLAANMPLPMFLIIGPVATWVMVKVAKAAIAAIDLLFPPRRRR